MSDSELSDIRESYVSGFELAKALLLSSSRISQLSKSGIFYRIDGEYPLVKSIQAYLNYLQQGKTDPFEPDLVIEKAKLIRVKRLQLEHDLAETRNGFVRFGEFKAELAAMKRVINEALSTFPDRVRDEARLNSEQTAYVKKSIGGLTDAIKDT